MRRTVLLTSVAAAILTSVTTFLVGQSAKPRVVEAPSVSVAVDRKSDAHSYASFYVANDTKGKLSPLQIHFLELSEKRARMMKEDQLQKAVAELERELNGLNASARLEEAKKILNEIIEKHDATEAAKLARAALDVIDNERSSTAEPFNRRKVTIPSTDKRGI